MFYLAGKMVLREQFTGGNSLYCKPHKFGRANLLPKMR